MVDHFSSQHPAITPALKNRAQPRKHDMVTIGYYPATGMNTIRLSSQKYEWVNPGDIVVMKYLKEGNTEYVLAVEKLTVRSVAYVPGHLLEASYMHCNHAIFEPATGKHRSMSDIWRFLRECYGAEVVDEPHTLFAVISFE